MRVPPTAKSIYLSIILREVETTTDVGDVALSSRLTSTERTKPSNTHIAA